MEQLLLFFNLFKVVDSENSPDNYKDFKISIEAILKNPEMLKLIPDHLKTKKMCKNTVKKSALEIMHVPD